MSGRIDLGFGSSEPPVIPGSTRATENRELLTKAAKAADGAGFKSRDVTPPATLRSPPPAATPDRRKRTGRDKAFACRTTPDAYDRFYAIVDGNRWGVGETFERALDALERELGIS